MKSDMQRYSVLFYTKEIILFAIRDYKKIAKIKMSEENGYYVCEFSDCVVNSAKVIHEFGNYLIELLNSQGANAEA